MITIKGQEKEIKFTFNSFKYMQDFNLSDFDEIEKYPFRIATICQTLLMGGLNNNPRDRISESDVDAYLEEFMVEGDISKLMETLVEKLQESSFFKSLQKSV